jgi:hypothetical protein
VHRQATAPFPAHPKEFSMFARQTRQHATALFLALIVTAGMLGAVDTRATHAGEDLQMAAAPAALQCPANA